MKGLDLRKFKKVSSDVDFTTLTHGEGHEIKVAHKSLSKAHKSQLDALPMAKGGEVPKKADKGPAVIQEYAEAMEAGATGRKVSKTVPDQGSPSSKPIKSPPPGYAEDQQKQATYKKSVQDFNAQLNRPEGYSEGGEVRHYADGTPDQPVQPEIVDIDLDNPPVSIQSTPAAASVTEAPLPMGQSSMHSIGSGIHSILSPVTDELGRSFNDTVEGAKAYGHIIGNGAQGLIQGLSGQALAPIPTMSPENTQVPPQPVAAGEPSMAPVENAPAQPTERTPAATPASTPNVGDKLMSAMDQQTRMEAKTLENAAKAQADLKASYDADFKKLAATRDAVFQEYKDEKIDPNHFWNSKSTVGKIGTILGLLVGGLGGSDQASKFVDQQIENDINAQKAELGKKQNLLDFNMKQFGNLKDATEMTRIMQMDIVKDNLALAAAKVGDPMRKAKLLEDVANYQKNIDERTAKVAAARAVSQAMNVARQDPSKTQLVADAVSGLDAKAGEDLRERSTPYGFANTKEGAKAVREMDGLVTNAEKGIKELLEINKMTGKSLSPETRGRAETIQQALIGALRLPITGPGAMNEGERKMLEKLVVNPTNLFNLDNSNKVRLETLSRRLREGMDITAKANGLSVHSQADKDREWATRNSNDPRAKEYLKTHGGK